MGISDRWDNLPDVVEQLVSEAEAEPLPPPPLAGGPRPAPRRGAPIKTPRPFRVAEPAEAQPIRLDSLDLIEMPTETSRRPRPTPSREEPAAREPAARPQPQGPTVTAPPVRVEARLPETPTSAAPAWPGLPDYDALLAQPKLDPELILRRMETEAQEALGPRAKVLGPLFERVRAELAQIQSRRDARDPSVQLETLRGSLDDLEDILEILLVTS